MMQNIDDPRLLAAKRSNETAKESMFAGSLLAPYCPPLGGGVQLYGLSSLWDGKNQYFELVADEKPWDFKHTIQEYLGEGITLCSTNECHNNVEFSVPGNIHFGFVSKEAGYNNVVMHAGGSYAEIADPAHWNPDHKNYAPYEFDIFNMGKFGPNLNEDGLGSRLNFGDDPQDHQAVQFGWNLYKNYGRNLTYAQFKQELSSALPLFTHHEPRPNPVQPHIVAQWPYRPGFFAPLAE